MKLLFIHGWSVTSTDTYGVLPQVLAASAPAGMNLSIEHVFLGQYVSFKDEVRMSDLVVALDHALKDTLRDNERFSCITHSTGGPVVREWVNTYYGKDKLSQLPMDHLIMLAPANHGSALAQLGKARVGRMKAWFDGVEPGQGILDWLELGSLGQWQLNTEWMEYPFTKGFYPFVITGQDIDKKFYDYLNAYTAEKGGDGVVRVAATNLNYRLVDLLEDVNSSVDFRLANGDKGTAQVLSLAQPPKLSVSRTPIEILPNTSHSQKSMGIMASVTKGNQARKQVVASIFECLAVASEADYRQVDTAMQSRTAKVQKPAQQYSMVVFRVVDSTGKLVTDYDLYLLGGSTYMPDKLPKGFFADKQKNKVNQSHLTYFFNHDKLKNIADGKIGFRVIARPSEGFAFYKPVEFRSDGIEFSELLIANQTLLVQITLNRYVDQRAFLFTPASEGNVDFKKRKPSGEGYPVS